MTPALCAQRHTSNYSPRPRQIRYAHGPTSKHRRISRGILLARYLAVVRVTLVVLVALLVSVAAVHAQPLPRANAGDLLAGRPVLTTFEAVQSVLDNGREVVVTDEDGRQRRGRVVALSSDRIVLSAPVSSGGWEAMLPLYWPADVAVMLKRRLVPSGDRGFDEAVVTRIDVVDPTGNGTALGAAVGVAVSGVVYLWERQQPAGSLKGLWTTMSVMVGIPISMRMGHVIDRATNAPIYQRSSRPSQTTLVPLVGHDRAAALVAVRW